MPSRIASVLAEAALPAGVSVLDRSVDRFSRAHDASHYLLVPSAVVQPTSAEEVSAVFRACSAQGIPITLRSGGTSLSGQAVSDSVLLDTRQRFQRMSVSTDGTSVTVQPGLTIRQVNARLARFHRRLGPDPASEIACTVGGVIANNSSGMACGIEQNTYRTLRSLVVTLASGTMIDTGSPDSDDTLLDREPALHTGLRELRESLLRRPDLVAEIRHQYSMKNTMGYGLNSLLDFDRPIDILAHLLIGSEGTLGFVSEATFETVPVSPSIATGLLVFPDLRSATAALPHLVAAGLATIELMDATSLRVAQSLSDVPTEIAAIRIVDQAALLIEHHATDEAALRRKITAFEELFGTLELTSPFEFVTDPAARASLWHVRKGLYTAVAGARPSGTTALLEDIAVPVERLLETCERLNVLFSAHGYTNTVIFGHAKDGNIHFMISERFDDPDHVARYERFTADLVDLVLEQRGTLKAEHGTGRIMAPFVRRQFGDELYEVMRRIKRLFDPLGILNPGVLLSDDPSSYLHNLKSSASVEPEVDRCVECGYCEPTCPSKNLTLTPRQRIVLRREMRAAEDRGDTGLLSELAADYDYDGVQTCAVDGMCAVACPVDINTGDLVRRLREETANRFTGAGWSLAAKHWGAVTRAGGAALTLADALPAPLITAATDVGRALLGADEVPRYSGDLPRGGRKRPATGETPAAQAVFFAACIGTMFGPGGDGVGSSEAFRLLAGRAGVAIVEPEGVADMCCGTPWKSKGHTDGYATMSERVLPSLLAASDGGRLPIVCDAASCTEGLETMAEKARSAGPQYASLRFIDSVEFTNTNLLGKLAVTTPLASVALHRTCSTTALNVNDHLAGIARAISEDVYEPIDWGCCAFAGDRGMLHPELTASATEVEASEINSRTFEAYASANRTCELGMSRATGRTYVHILELLEQATRAG
ncbi:FAD-binding oxidoreductase [Leifsonia shinshuensis]|uniref:FAD-binding and (Fe-S)-binding domain-containing protein n=1 Tax=Leifsonia shinshuensis TaxID=150026 RepID=UPI001F50BF72|nr:FAD-binding and (Fe-S)-binding domain-containing protein [Leifsonia shinshuensis]MCI0158064.1 FAD-binding oxidoreductase [Leifsonia shinshuensis]